MAKKRTKKQKIKTQLKQQVQFSWQPIDVIQASPDNQEKKLIIKDLWKTVWVALILGLVLSAAVIYLKPGNGGLTDFFGGLTSGQK